MLAWRGAIALGLVTALAACDEEATRPAPASVSVSLEACFGAQGGAESTCRATLEEQVADGTNGCFVVQRRSDSARFYIPLRWSGRSVEPAGPGVVDVTPGDSVDAALFLFSAFDAGQCAAGGLGVDTSCGDGCVVKLRQAEVTIGEDNTVISFDAGGTCAVERPEGAVLVEVCDGLDNDCDGQIDNGFGLTEAGGEPATCSVGVGACARDGQVVCNADGSGTECNAQEGQPSAEICDGLDNDCDGAEDENIAVDECCTIGDTRACGMAVGACGTGTQTCEGQGAKGAFGDCVDGAGNPVIVPNQQMETCNGLDDDCDGETDEDVFLEDSDLVQDGVQRAPVGGDCIARDGECAAGGVVECGPDGLPVCSFDPVQRGAEVCDNGDNDCDGLIDETFPGLGEACEVGRGACLQVGRVECADQASVACSAVEGQPGPELCDNGEDDDCDGTTDEGFDQLGDACTSGIGICRANGSLVCAANGEALICDAEAGAAVDELCDQLDNDCDGNTDEDFDTTDDPQNCGACGRDCGPIVVNGVAGCEASECTVVACLPGFDDQDNDPLNGCECNPDNEDLPDPDYVDTNCDGLDGDVDRAIFVSDELGDDENTGGRNDPFQTLAHAINAADVVSRDIYLDSGTYDVTRDNDDPNAAAEGLVVPAGISIYGGYRFQGDGTWLRGDRAQFRTEITGAQRVLTFQGDQGDVQVFLANVTVVTGAPVDHPFPTVGVAAVDVGDNLVLRNVQIVAGDGADGPDGADGADATALGGAGQRGVDGDSLDRAGLAGVGGQNPSCPAQQGGSGGNGRQNAQNAQGGAEGSTGVQDGAGQPGQGGPPGEDGDPGLPGAHGGNTAGGTIAGRVSGGTGLWVPRPTGNALTGGPGGGGGGGGGGTANRSGGGGGGGAGGCAGSGGRGAQGGAMSVGLYVIGSIVHLQGVDIVSGRGGDGGRGGHGGRREEGRGGGLGGAGDDAASTGGNGGRGGNGGCGGHAGGGGAGSSFAIFRASTSNVEADLDASRVVFEDLDGRALANQDMAAQQSLTAGEAGTPGAGGGGDRADVCGAQAESGDEGIARRIGCCPIGRGANNCNRLTCD